DRPTELQCPARDTAVEPCGGRKVSSTRNKRPTKNTCGANAKNRIAPQSFRNIDKVPNTIPAPKANPAASLIELDFIAAQREPHPVQREGPRREARRKCSG